MVISWLTKNERPVLNEVQKLNPDLKTYWNSYNRLKLHKGVLYRTWEKVSAERPDDLICVPAEYQDKIIKICHDIPASGHCGIINTLKRVQKTFYWPKMQLHISLYVKACVLCIKKAQNYKTPRAPLTPFNGTCPGDIVEMDILENCPPSKGYKSILIMVDRFTCWPEAIPLRQTKTEYIARAFVEHWVCNHGIPIQVQTDRGPALHTANVIKRVYELLGIYKSATTAYHPQSDGGAEAMVKNVKKLLWTYCQENKKNWINCLNQCLFAIRTSIHSATGFSPYFLHRGQPCRIPLDLMFNTHTQQHFDSRGQYGYYLFKTLKHTHEIVEKNLKTNRDFMKKQYDKRQKIIPYKPGDYVFVWRPRPAGNKNKWFDHWFGPYKILANHTQYTYKLDIGTSSRMYDILPHDLLRLAPPPTDGNLESRDYDNYIINDEGSDHSFQDNVQEELSWDDYQSGNDGDSSTELSENDTPMVFGDHRPRIRRSHRNRRQAEHYQAGYT